MTRRSLLGGLGAILLYPFAKNVKASNETNAQTTSTGRWKRINCWIYGSSPTDWRHEMESRRGVILTSDVESIPWSIVCDSDYVGLIIHVHGTHHQILWYKYRDNAILAWNGATRNEIKQFFGIDRLSQSCSQQFGKRRISPYFVVRECPSLSFPPRSVQSIQTALRLNPFR